MRRAIQKVRGGGAWEGGYKKRDDAWEGGMREGTRERGNKKRDDA